MGCGAGHHAAAAAWLDALMPSTSRASNGTALRALADGRARTIAPLIAEIRESGAVTYTEIAQKLNERGSVTPHGNLWSGTRVRRVMQRLGLR